MYDKNIAKGTTGPRVEFSLLSSNTNLDTWVLKTRVIEKNTHHFF